MAKNQFIELAEKYEPPIYKALIKAWNTMRTRINQKELEIALASGGVDAAMAFLDSMPKVIDVAIGADINDAIGAGGAEAFVAIPSAAILVDDFRFDPYNPFAAEYISNYQLGLVTSISNNSREAIRNAITRDIVQGRNPIATARTFKNTIGLTANQEKAVYNFRTMLENLDSGALTRKLRDHRFDSTIINAIKNKEPLTELQIERMTNRYRERYIQYRSRMIARTESLRAVSIGNHLSTTQMINNGDIDGELTRKFWSYTKDERTRKSHRTIPSLNPDGRRIDEPFVTPLGPLMYPRDPKGSGSNTIACRCSVYYKVLET